MSKENQAAPAAKTASGAVIEDRSSAPAVIEVKREHRHEELANGVVLTTVVSVEPRGDVTVGGVA